MTRLDLYYLGIPHVELDNRIVELRLAKSGALLAYLAVTGKQHRRAALATLLWPESDTAHGLSSLRSILLEINNVLGRGWVIADRKTLYINPEAQIWLDTHHFSSRIVACRTHSHPETEACPHCLPLLTTAVDLYRGDFMDGFLLRDSLDFDEWQLFQVEHFRKLQVDTLERLIRFYSTQGMAGVKRAIDFARRYVALDPLDELAHQQLMQLYIQSGHLSEARRQYQLCEQILSKDSGVSPSADMVALLRQIDSPSIPLVGRQPPPFIVSEETALPEPIPFVSGLPASLTPFVGREAERAAIAFLLRGTPTCRLVTLVGPGGVGKTRLAIQVSEDIAPAFPQGVVFVPLDSVDFPEYLASKILEHFPAAVPSGESDLTTLLAYLHDKTLLLLLDSFDNVLGHTDVLDAILHAAPYVKLLVTSQEPLYMHGEWLVKVPGIEYPPEDAENLEDYQSVQLFLQAARRVQPDFKPTGEDWPWIARICRLVDGMPLGVELAAIWVRMLSCREITLRIEDSLEFLTTSLRNVPPRHRSLRAVFEHTWGLLSPEERRVFQQISVFVGGFCEEAAVEVVQATLPVLLALVDRGLLHRRPSGRYDRHPLLWGYAAEKLAGDLLARNAVRERHCAYYAAFLKKKLVQLSHAPKPALEAIEADIENIRAALHWSVSHPHSVETGQTLEQLYYYYERREWLHEKGGVGDDV